MTQRRTPKRLPQTGLFERPLLSSVVYLRVDQVDFSPESPPRKLIPEVATDGIILPILVKAPNSAGRFETIDGNSRLFSAQTYGLDTLPGRILDASATPGDAASLTLITNLAREVNLVHEARKIATMLEEGYTPESVRARTGLKMSDLKVRLKLLELPGELLERVGVQIALGTLRQVANLPEPYRKEVCQHILLATLNPEVKFGAADLREARVAQKSDLNSRIRSLPRPPIANSPLQVAGPTIKVLTQSAATPTPLPTPPLLAPSLKGLVEAFVRDARSAGHRVQDALEALLERVVQEASSNLSSATAPLEVPALEIPAQVVPAQVVPVLETPLILPAAPPPRRTALGLRSRA